MKRLSHANILCIKVELKIAEKSKSQIALDYKTSRSTIRRICTGAIYADVPTPSFEVVADGCENTNAIPCRNVLNVHRYFSKFMAGQQLMDVLVDTLKTVQATDLPECPHRRDLTMFAIARRKLDAVLPELDDSIPDGDVSGLPKVYAEIVSLRRQGRSNNEIADQFDTREVVVKKLAMGAARMILQAQAA